MTLLFPFVKGLIWLLENIIVKFDCRKEIKVRDFFLGLIFFVLFGIFPKLKKTADWKLKNSKFWIQYGGQ